MKANSLFQNFMGYTFKLEVGYWNVNFNLLDVLKKKIANRFLIEFRSGEILGQVPSSKWSIRSDLGLLLKGKSPSTLITVEPAIKATIYSDYQHIMAT